MERVTDRDFCAVRTARLSSTGVDRHGDRIPLPELQRFKRQIEETPELRLTRLDHQYDRISGEILDVWIEEDEDESEDIHYLSAEIGIFEGNEHIVGKIESGELSGMSLSIAVYENCESEDWDDLSPNLQVGVDGHYREELNHFLKRSGNPYRIQIQKSVEGDAIFEFAVVNKESILQLLSVVMIWLLNRKYEGVSVEFPDLNLIKVENNIDIESVFNRVVESDEVPDIDGSELTEEEEQEVKKRIVEELADELELLDDSDENESE